MRRLIKIKNIIFKIRKKLNRKRLIKMIKIQKNIFIKMNLMPFNIYQN
jgi:hypothetical protein